MPFPNSSAMARSIPAALSAKATGLFPASRKPFTREREALASPTRPGQSRALARKGEMEERPRGLPDPTFSGDSSRRGPAGRRGKGVLSSPPSPSCPRLSAPHPRGSVQGRAGEGGRPCGLERLGALRGEAQASGKAWFTKLTLTLAGFANPRPVPESEPLADLSLDGR